MIRAMFRAAILALVIAPAWCEGAAPPSKSQDDSPPLNGLWFGAWGGGPQPGGVVFQPVIAEMFVKNDHVELAGFPDVPKLEGTLRIDRDAKRIHIAQAADPGKSAAPKTFDYSFAIDGDKIVLTLADKRSLSLQPLKTSQKPLANVAVELVSADEITDSGELIVSEFSKLRVGNIAATYYEPATRKLQTKHASVLVVEESDCKKTTVGEAKSRFKRSMPVAIAFRPEDRPNQNQLHQLWTEIGSAAADDAAARQTLAKTLRPGTLVFVLNSAENAPVP